jgi:hypothetical protein
VKAANDNQAVEIAHLEAELADLKRKIGTQTAQR